MSRLIGLFVILMFSLGGTGAAQISEARAALPNNTPEVREGTVRATESTSLPDIPSLPQGKATEIGGAIHQIDHVRDEIAVKVFGGKDIKVLFDGRTTIYRDGQRISAWDLKNGDAISLETMLDGSSVFARSIHTLSHSLTGQCRGQVLNFDRSRGELTVRDTISPDPIKVRISSGTIIAREGQQAASTAELGTGALVAVDFVPESGKAVARRIAILATPGNEFVFSGRVDFLDLHEGLLVITDPRDQKRYEVSFDPQHISESYGVHIGSEVTVNADFNGSRYLAKSIAVNPPASQ